LHWHLITRGKIFHKLVNQNLNNCALNKQRQHKEVCTREKKPVSSFESSWMGFCTRRPPFWTSKCDSDQIKTSFHIALLDLTRLMDVHHRNLRSIGRMYVCMQTEKTADMARLNNFVMYTYEKNIYQWMTQCFCWCFLDLSWFPRY
jgi:hypothetical protein